MQTTPFKGFLLAGDWVQTGAPASMEGACRSGYLAAQVVLRSRGVQADLVHDIPETEGIVRFISAFPRFGARRIARHTL